MTLVVLGPAPVCSASEAVREDRCDIGRDLGIPVTRWSDPSVAQKKAVIVTLHGIVMHGGSFDALARRLAGQGYLVVAPDMRGHGRCYFEPESPEQKVIDYARSEADIVRLVGKLKQEDPRRPIFLVGESLGADMAMRVDSKAPDCVDGLVLSSPALKRRVPVLPRLVQEAPRLWTNPTRQIDLTTTIKRSASDDPKISQEIIDDPLVRKGMSAFELLQSLRVARSALSFVEKIPATTPVLIIQGNEDRTVKANAVVLLLSRLKSQDQTVKWFPNRGHVLLETAFVKPVTLATVEAWLGQHTRPDVTLEAASRGNARDPLPN